MPATKSITCRYLAYRLGGQQHSRVIRLPLVQVNLRHGDREISTVALVDSGSTSTFLPSEFIDILGLTNLRRSTAVGAGGSFSTHVGKLDLLQVSKGTPFDAFRQVTVHIPEVAGAIPYTVLGRDTIIRHFDITFHERRQKITFTQL